MLPKTLWLTSTVVFAAVCIILVGFWPTVVVTTAVLTWATLNMMNEALASGNNVDEEWQDELED